MSPNQIINRVFAMPEADEFVRVCAWCKRVKLDDEWLALPQAELEAAYPNSISHTVCPDCAKGIEADLRHSKAKRCQTAR